MSSKADFIAQQLGHGCNAGNKFVIKEFKGRLIFMYGQKTDEMQDHAQNLAAMTSDFGGVTPVLNIKCDKILGPNITIPLHPTDSLGGTYLSDLIGQDLTITYEPIDHCAILLIHEPFNE